MTDSDEDMLSMDEDYPDESENEEDVEDADEEDIIAMEQEVTNVEGPKVAEDDYRYDILTGDQVVEFMQDIIRDVNNVVQVICLLLVFLSH
jgi:hypothetical protein